MSKGKKKQEKAAVIDLFCGIGGLSHGFRLEGFDVVAGIDTDEECRYPYEHNNKAPFLRRDVTELLPDELADLYPRDRRRILVGCAPCQPFSIYNQKNEDPNWRLLKDFGRLIADLRPDVVSMENVPSLLQFRGGGLFEDFVDILRRARYRVNWDVLYCPDFGVPQTRSRLVLLASQLGDIAMPRRTHSPNRHKTVADAIGSLPAIEAGGADTADPLHQSSRMSAVNLRRIRASTPGGTWRDWPDELVTACHKRDSGRGYAAVYGRMSWDEPSPTITTQFFGFGNGRFGHPEQDRGLSLREGAILQSFPDRYAFTAPETKVEFKKLGRMIGNAVPVSLARAIARAIDRHLKEHY